MILQSPDYEFASWNECETEPESIKSRADEGKHFVWTYSGKPILPTAKSSAGEPPVEEPPAEQPVALDEQLEIYPNATLGNRLENACDRHDKLRVQGCWGR